jgi:hypothetical protein
VAVTFSRRPMQLTIAWTFVERPPRSMPVGNYPAALALVTVVTEWT